MEVIAAVALVGTIVSTFKESVELFRDWRQKKKERGQNAENGALEQSLVSGGRGIQSEYERHFARLGQRFATGDEQGRHELSQYVIKLQHTIITLMTRSGSVTGNVFPDLPLMVASSDTTRTGAIDALAGQYQRMRQAAPLFSYQPRQHGTPNDIFLTFLSPQHRSPTYFQGPEHHAQQSASSMFPNSKSNAAQNPFSHGLLGFYGAPTNAQSSVNHTEQPAFFSSSPLSAPDTAEDIARYSSNLVGASRNAQNSVHHAEQPYFSGTPNYTPDASGSLLRWDKNSASWYIPRSSNFDPHSQLCGGSRTKLPGGFRWCDRRGCRQSFHKVHENPIVVHPKSGELVEISSESVWASHCVAVLPGRDNAYICRACSDGHMYNVLALQGHFQSHTLTELYRAFGDGVKRTDNLKTPFGHF
ncbi:hypothetical protein MMC11_008967 [Xylographa trunciseda]|nr:hypothetical protein [Xylographa trunciseda]